MHISCCYNMMLLAGEVGYQLPACTPCCCSAGCLLLAMLRSSINYAAQGSAEASWQLLLCLPHVAHMLLASASSACHWQIYAT
jgi:hypothetical protein